MDLRWLTAPDHQVAETVARTRAAERPSWMPTRRQALLHVNNCLLLWAMALTWFVLGVRIDTMQNNRITPADVRDMTVVIIVFLGWGAVTYALIRWSRRPPSRRARVAEWRQQLTGAANGFNSSPTENRTFRALITDGGRPTLFHPRFTRSNLEFGSLRRKRASNEEWSYLAVQLPVPVPHVILSASRAGGLAKQLPVRVAQSQRLPLEGNFDTWFHAYAPEGYERDALFVLVPDVMAALIDHASAFNVELVDDRVIFFTPASRSFSAADTWRDMDALIKGALPSLVRAAVRYRDERVPGQHSSLAVAAILSAIQTPDATWMESARTIGPHGKRLRLFDRRTGWWGLLGLVTWVISLVLLYVVPGLFLFAAIMSIVDGH